MVGNSEKNIKMSFKNNVLNNFMFGAEFLMTKISNYDLGISNQFYA